ncbi:MAG TPA: dTDP-4-dehydrorhamnose reductase [Bacteroidales bacterium]|nr:MAG: dTDP-4-dehydrorhamnose reductase [Bacteroidetes bacterium GWF2_33_38]OFY68711.1 MAG: dTDP-4-dehydrorhamnose reductase [Bacteroidetes bacterium RIFOXYA12_FULL_33_9]HBF88667.1 dTDP-4-dehydrorhamnose reductase [Bacteroidales bacterium]
MAKILVTGAKGQLGNELFEISKKNKNHQFFYTDIDDLDILDKEMVKEFISGLKPNYLINCAAYTAVDKAEQEQELAEKVNFEAVKNISSVCKYQNVRLIHISTDYVFDGTSCVPYVENTKVNPISVYGKTKLKGEKAVLASSDSLEAIIIRTSWLYSSFGNNFVKTILKYGKERNELKVVFDQIGTPTYARDLAKAIIEIIDYSENKNEFKKGIYNFSNEGVCSWYDFANEIVSFAKIDCIIKPIRTIEYPTAAIRPAYSVLDKSKIKSSFNIEIPYWKNSLKDCLKKIK